MVQKNDQFDGGNYNADLSAIRFYQKLGFQIAGEETQSVNGERVPYFNMVLEL